VSAALYDPGPQSGGRRPAPGRLALVQAFLNTHFSLGEDRGADVIATPAGLAGWLAARGLPPGEPGQADVERAIALREALRGALAGDAAGGDLVTTPATVGFTLDAAGRAVPVPQGEGVGCLLGVVLAAVHEAQAGGTWRRLKACPGPHCGWAFYDHSRNRSGAWCSMRVCGGREKARAYRRRTHVERRDRP
jgi:predicted RNA-binding Zn ribbon-like protein